MLSPDYRESPTTGFECPVAAGWEIPESGAELRGSGCGGRHTGIPAAEAHQRLDTWRSV